MSGCNLCGLGGLKGRGEGCSVVKIRAPGALGYGSVLQVSTNRWGQGHTQDTHVGGRNSSDDRAMGR